MSESLSVSSVIKSSKADNPLQVLQVWMECVSVIAWLNSVSFFVVVVVVFIYDQNSHCILICFQNDGVCLIVFLFISSHQHAAYLYYVTGSKSVSHDQPRLSI